MSWFTRLSMRSGPVVLIAILLVFGAGILAATQLQQALLPNISVPEFVAVIGYKNASPQIVDEQVTQPAVAAVQDAPDVNAVLSRSSAGVSILEVTFNDGTNSQTDQQNLASALQKAQAQFPPTAGAPSITAFSTALLPVLTYSVYGEGSLGSLATRVNQVAVPKLEGLSGVSAVQVAGAPTEQVLVTVDQASLAQHGLTEQAVVAAIEQASLVQSVGSVNDNGTSVPVQVSGSLTSVQQIEAIPVTPTAGAGSTSGAAGTSGAAASGAAGASGAGGAAGATSGSGATGSAGSTTPTAVPVSEVASVQLVSISQGTLTRTNGNPSISLEILPAPTANTVDVANEVRAAIPGIKDSMGGDVTFQVIEDEATPITQAIQSILREGLLGALFAILVIFLFLRSVRATLVAAISIPTSLLAALIVLWVAGITLNILTLGAMMVAIGRVVDDSIVVLENVTRHVREGEHPVTAALSASREILGAVTASTLTTVAVFLPIAFLSGIAGDFFSPFAITVVVALLASLVVAVMVVPLIASRFIPRPKKVVADAARGALQRVYAPTLSWALGHRLITVLLALVLLLGSFALVPQLRVNLLDQSGGSTFTVSVAMGKQATLQQTNEQTLAVENLIKGVNGVSAYQAVVGTVIDPFAPPGTVPPDPTHATVTVVLASNADYNTVSSDVQKAISKDYHGPAAVQVEGASSSGTSSQITETVQNSDLQKLQTATNQVVGAFESIPGLSQVTSNLAADQPQINLVPTAQLASSGLTLQQVAAIVGAAVSGTVAAQAQLAQGSVNVSVVLPPGTADTPQALSSLPVPTEHGVVPLSTLVTLQQVDGPTSIDRSGNEQAATVTATITGNNQSEIQRHVTEKLNALSLPSGTTLGNSGTLADLSTVLRQFELAILAAIGLVYMIMVATFRSFLKPFVLLFSIPFAAIGAIVALTITHTALSLPALVGLLMLVGIVVTNAIVLLDLVEQYRDRGLVLHDALTEGGRRRLRPILMTAVATVLALTPLAVSGNTSGGGFISAPLAIVVIGGLCSSTLLTLVLIPVLYSLVSRFTGARRNAEQEALLDAATAGPGSRPSSDAPVPAAGAVVAISAAPGIEAAPVAERVAERLGLPLHDLTSRLDGWVGAVDSVLDDDRRSPRWLERLAGRLDGGDGPHQQVTPAWLLGSSLDLMTAGTGGVIVSPLAGPALAGRHPLRVRLDAPVDRRAQLARVDGEPLTATRARLRDQDAEQQAAISGMFGVDARPVFDITLDPTALPVDRVAGLIVAAMPPDGHETSAGGMRPATSPAR